MSFLNLPPRMSEDGPDLDERTVWVTCCRSCGWEDSEAYECQGDCTIANCPECGSDHLVDEEQTEEFTRGCA
jgi:hypothetical protein